MRHLSITRMEFSITSPQCMLFNAIQHALIDILLLMEFPIISWYIHVRWPIHSYYILLGHLPVLLRSTTTVQQWPGLSPQSAKYLKKKSTCLNENGLTLYYFRPLKWQSYHLEQTCCKNFKHLTLKYNLHKTTYLDTWFLLTTWQHQSFCQQNHLSQNHLIFIDNVTTPVILPTKSPETPSQYNQHKTQFISCRP